MNVVPRIHIVTNDEILERPDFIHHAAVFPDTDTVLHIRSTTLPGRKLQNIVNNLRRAGLQTPIIINDRVDVAVAVNAAGVHLPERGLPVKRVRAEFDDSLLIGRSTHTPEAACQATDDGADYAFLGPIWPTPSHPHAATLGLDALQTVKAGRILAIGGITPERAASCIGAGAYGVAVISAIWNAPEPASVARTFVSIIKETTTTDSAV